MTTLSDVDGRAVTVGPRRGFTIPRDVAATVVPAGDSLVVRAGEHTRIRQALGASASLELADGRLVRLSTDDAVEFGLIEPPVVGGEPTPEESGDFDLDRVWEALATVYDPELPVDVVELGLIYRCEATERADGGQRVEIDMSVTAPFCGMGDVLRADAAQRVGEVPGVAEVDVRLVFDPPWDASRLSPAAKLELGML